MIVSAVAMGIELSVVDLSFDILLLVSLLLSLSIWGFLDPLFN
jgi:hypothetical protein